MALAIGPSAAAEAKTADTQRLAHIQSVKQLKEDLDKHTYLRDRYIIFSARGRKRAILSASEGAGSEVH